MKAFRSQLTYANVMATVAVFLALGGGAYALTGIPDRAGVYHGCMDPKAGALRVVKAASSCRKTKTVRRGGRRVRILGESAIAWNQKGPAGQNGVNGAKGANGLNGVSGATALVVRTQVLTGAGGGATVQCNPGERAIGGGVSRSDSTANGNDTITDSAPAIVPAPPTPPRIAQAGETANGWISAVSSINAVSRTFFAVCASP